ncbi:MULTISPECIES: TetR/AcrR family transcriptional regulator [Paenibacillus]|uniref:TetR family transcriptional regulator n=1 Tax=Paenibacillus odorifer TaxID=189426 RepID=A0A1R0XHJ8_9BACL|nr:MULTISPECIES: TetR/AcrR family transcriptional regulator [Paenibacillus]AIQ35025.1 transcriptional regulator [Paenibacillus sp. FSL R5-0345]OMD34551.1 TetR family transcriptional regulator [Paenibacillus odorifer]
MSSTSNHKHTAILDAAYELFGSGGFYETKMSEIAEQAGIAKGTVYLYFKSKEELFMAVTRRDCEGFLQQLQEKLKASDTLAGKLSIIAKHHLYYYFERKRHTKLFFRAPNNNPELVAYMTLFMEEYMQAVVKVLLEGGASEPELMAQSYIGMLDRLKMDILFDPSFKEEDAYKRAGFAAGLFIKGAMDYLNLGQDDRPVE